MAQAHAGFTPMTAAQWDAIRELRHAGYAVCIFTPEELQGASQKLVQDRLVEVGWEIIEAAK